MNRDLGLLLFGLVPSLVQAQVAARVTLPVDSLGLVRGQTTRVKCTAYKKNGVVIVGATCNWYSRNIGVITALSPAVTTTVSGIGVGGTWLVAGRSGKKDSAWVRVTQGTVNPIQVVVKPDLAILVVANEACKALATGWANSDTLPVPSCIGPDLLGVNRYMVQQWCAFIEGNDGKMWLTENQANKKYCQLWYDRFPSTVRLPGYPIARSRTPVWPFEIRIEETEQAHGIILARPRVRMTS